MVIGINIIIYFLIYIRTSKHLEVDQNFYIDFVRYTKLSLMFVGCLSYTFGNWNS